MDELTPDKLALTLQELGSDQLAKLSHALLYQTRSRMPRGAEQNRLAGFEHRAFAREVVQENPFMAIPLLAAIPAYQGYKAVTGNSRSSGSLNQVLQGYTGIGEGVRALLSDSSQ